MGDVIKAANRFHQAAIDSYISAGRRFSLLPDDKVTEGWRAAFRVWVKEPGGEVALMFRDLDLELSLRGLEAPRHERWIMAKAMQLVADKMAPDDLRRAELVSFAESVMTSLGGSDVPASDASADLRSGVPADGPVGDKDTSGPH